MDRLPPLFRQRRKHSPLYPVLRTAEGLPRNVIDQRHSKSSYIRAEFDECGINTDPHVILDRIKQKGLLHAPPSLWLIRQVQRDYRNRLTMTDNAYRHDRLRSLARSLVKHLGLQAAIQLLQQLDAG